MKRSKWLLLVGLSLVFYCAIGQNAQLQNRIQAVENGLIPLVPIKGFKSWNIEERMKHYNIKGVSIAVINNFKVEWSRAYGWADTAKKIRMTTSTMLSAGSISKMVMAAGALKMVQQNKLALDSPINTYLKSWKLGENDYTRKTPVTLRMLLSHTAGTSQSAYFGYEAGLSKYPSLVEILDGRAPDGTRKVSVVKEPKTGFQYSGGGSLVAQLAMMDVSGSSFENLMRKLVFEQLGMTNATFEQPLSPKYAKQASWGYQDVSWYKGTPYVYPQQAAAGLYSTPTDLATFIVDLQQSYQGKGKILTKAMVKEMMTPQAIFQEGNVSKEQIAVGPFLYQRPDNTEDRGIYFNFDGANAGFIASAMGNLTEGYGVVIMVNSGNDFNGLCKEIRRAVAKTYDWYKFLPEEITPMNMDSQTLEQYTGRYRKNENEVVCVTRESNYLKVRYNNDYPIYTFPVARDTVIFTDYNIRGWFTRNKQGQIMGIQNEYQKEMMPKMKDDEFSIGELLQMKRYEEAKILLRKINADESQLTYLAYERSKDFGAAKAILEVAEERFPNSSMVLSNFGKLYLAFDQKAKALEYFEKALRIEPGNQELKEQIRVLKN
jgi:CubicO group peptidase (beta-lactamase class C family)